MAEAQSWARAFMLRRLGKRCYIVVNWLAPCFGRGGKPMVGILLTLIAVLLVICLAFYFFDPDPDERFRRMEQLFFINPRRSGRGKGGSAGDANP